MNKEQIRKEIDNAFNKWKSWDSFTITRKGHGFEIEFSYMKGIEGAMPLEDVVIWKQGKVSQNVKE